MFELFGFCVRTLPYFAYLCPEVRPRGSNCGRLSYTEAARRQASSSGKDGQEPALTTRSTGKRGTPLSHETPHHKQSTPNPNEKRMTEHIQSETVWMPLQTIYNKELLVGEYLREKHIEYYIPMSYELHEAHGDPEQGRRTLVPAIHNLLFIRCRYDEEWCRRFVRESPHPVYFLKRERAGNGFCTVGEAEMQNFIRATNPDIEGTRFVNPEKLKGKKGTPVRIVKPGPLYGVTGTFVRYGGKHYIAIQMPQSTTLIKVSYTWCELIE